MQVPCVGALAVAHGALPRLGASDPVNLRRESSLGMAFTRRTLQAAFLILTLVGVFLFSGNAERWCPFGGVEALYTYVREGNLTCSLAVSNFYILAAVLLMTLLLRRAFCGHVCPLGTIFAWAGSAARNLGLRTLNVPAPLDRTLSLLKYGVLGAVLYFTWRTGELVFRGYDPCYVLISRHGEDITFWAYVISALLLLASVLLPMPFCRWLCPLAAVLNPFSRVALSRVKRDDDACISCGRCAAVCPMAIPVDRLREVTAARCITCLRCMEHCPVTLDGALTWGPPGRRAGRWSGAVLAAVVLSCTFAAVAAAYLLPLPSFRASRGELADRTEQVQLRVEGLDCRGRANLLKYFLERDDLYAIEGGLRLDAWPGPGAAALRVTFDPHLADPARIRRAITEPYFDSLAGVWRFSPFRLIDP